MPEPLSSMKWSTEYENYSQTSSQYDETRVQVGLAFIDEVLASLGAVDELRILDAGCGTGNYINTLRNRVQNIVGIDLNEGMLKHANQKFHDDPTVTLKRGSLTEIPCDDGQFDAVMCNQVVHHLADSDAENRFSRIQIMTNEVFRVLRPGGAFVLNLSTPEQTENGFWWPLLIPAAVEQMTKRCPATDEIHEMLTNAGFKIIQTTAGRIINLLIAQVPLADQSSPVAQFFEMIRDGDLPNVHAIGWRR